MMDGAQAHCDGIVAFGTDRLHRGPEGDHRAGPGATLTCWLSSEGREDGKPLIGTKMGPIFKYDFRVRIWPLAYIPYGGHGLRRNPGGRAGD